MPLCSKYRPVCGVRYYPVAPAGPAGCGWFMGGFIGLTFPFLRRHGPTGAGGGHLALVSSALRLRTT